MEKIQKNTKKIRSFEDKKSKSQKRNQHRSYSLNSFSDFVKHTSNSVYQLNEVKTININDHDTKKIDLLFKDLPRTSIANKWCSKSDEEPKMSRNF